MSEIRIADRRVGDAHPTYVIAEIGVNHNGIVEYAIELIDAAARAGADAVKFQKRDLESLYPARFLEDPNVGEKNLNYLLPILQRVELSDEDYARIVDHCGKRGVTFLCSAWDPKSADFIDELGVPAFKIASADLTNFPLLEHIAGKKKPIIVSTGMSRLAEVEATVSYLEALGSEFALLHCNSTYPAGFEDINLRFIERLRDFGVPVGYSGHERGIAVSTVASALGACMIERHITLDRTMEGPDHAASLEPQGFTKMVRDIRVVEASLGTGDEKYFTRGEILNREVLGKSLVAAHDIAIGEKITRSLIAVKGPGQGLSPQRLYDLIGREAVRDIAADDMFVDADIGEGIPLEFESTLPMQWGVVVRFRDFEEALPFHPPVLEFHLTEKDLDQPYDGPQLESRLVIHAPEFWSKHLVDLCSRDDAHRRASVRLVQRSIDVTRQIASHFAGEPKVVVHPGAASLDHPIENIGVLYDNLRRSVEELDFEGVEFLLENLPPRPWYFGGQWLTNAFMDAHEIRDFIEALKMKICYDTSHHKLYCNVAHSDFYEQAEILLPYAGHLHLSDAAGLDGEGLQIGDGGIDWVRFFRIAANYHGTMIPEIWRGHQRGNTGFLVALSRLGAAYSQASRLTE